MLELFKSFFNLFRTTKVEEPVIEDAPPVVYEEFTQPKFNRIQNEPIIALKDDHLVLVFDHQFDNIPSWVEWDKERSIVTISHMNGDTDEAPLEIKDDFIPNMQGDKKILLVSNDNDEKIMHYVQFLSRI